MKFACSVCCVALEKVKRCKKCRAAMYCSTECQIYAWKHMDHKTHCRGRTVRFKISKQWGRHMVASRTISAGECFWVEMSLEKVSYGVQDTNEIQGRCDLVFNEHLFNLIKYEPERRDSIVMSQMDCEMDTFAKDDKHLITDDPLAHVLNANAFSFHCGNNCQQGSAFFANSSYVNGSRHGNAFFVLVGSGSKVFVCFHAYREIACGEQIFLNYKVDNCACVYCLEGTPCHQMAYSPDEIQTIYDIQQYYYPGGCFDDLYGSLAPPVSSTEGT